MASLSECDFKLPCCGKNAIVTGGASGIGQATVEKLAKEGSTVAIFDINVAAGSCVAKELVAKGYNVVFEEVDVSSKDNCVEAVKRFAERNNGKRKPRTGEKSFSVNVFGCANMVQACHPYMKQCSGTASVVNVASISGHRAQPSRWTYASTKGAILALTKCMALDLSADKIRVNSISPAWVWSPEVSKAAGGDREKWEPVWGPFHMLRRLCETSEVATAICFLLSEDASFITGTDLPVDGGYMSMGPEGLGSSSSFAGTDY
ncbi:hypothetical protein EMCRGX_G023061 [Ephydatia muelleri]